ncbi:MAG: CDP-alcohol phosphatidyltransferase [Gemmataceae bacterium]|nr:CDP-alcohol phosphatidyltransferase [Gemmataceae bacterium]
MSRGAWCAKPPSVFTYAFDHHVMVRRLLAWCAHAYTALGLVAVAAIAVAIYDGRFQHAFLWMFVATIIDATDGMLARAVKVKEVLPNFDGRRLDDLIDFQTFTTLPLFLMWRANLLPEEWQAILLAPLVASAYGFCQVSAKTQDGYFLGFPSYWNIIAFYLYLLQPPAWLTMSLLLFFAVMTFVPARYLYPTHRGRLNRWTNWLGGVWGIFLIWILWRWHEDTTIEPVTRVLVLISLVFPAYYLLVSWWISVRIVVRAHRQRHA